MSKLNLLSLNLSQLKKCFSGWVFGFLSVILICYCGFKATTFKPMYECTMTLQAPRYSELLGVKSKQVLRERISFLLEHKVFIEDKGELLKFSMKGVTPEMACSEIVLIKEYVLNHVNIHISVYAKALRRESQFLKDFFKAIMEKNPNMSNEIQSKINSDKQLHELLRRKISVDNILDNTSLLGFTIISDVQIIAPSELYFDIRKKFSFIALFLVYSALISFLVGYFRLRLKIEKFFHDNNG